MNRLVLGTALWVACAPTVAPPPVCSSEDTAEEPPVVDLAIAPPTLVESPSSSTTFTLSLDRDPPPSGVRVYVRGDVPQSLTQGDLFRLAWTPADGDGPVGDLTFSGFTFLLTGRDGSVTLPSFDDRTEEAPVTVSFSVVAFDEVPWGALEIEGEPAACPYVVGEGTASLELRDGA